MLRHKHLQPRKRKLLTCVIGATCAEGCVIISDTRTMREFEANNESKIHVLWDRVALAGAGTTALLDDFASAIKDSKIPIAPSFGKTVQLIEDTMYALQERYQPRLGSDYDLQPIMMGLKDFDNGDPYLRLVHGHGFSEDIKEYAIIGHGAPYAASLFRLLYDNMLNVTEVAVLGFFTISAIISLGLDQTVGMTALGPEAIVLRANEKPEPNEPLLHFLRRTRQFDRLLLCAWSELEFNTDQAVTGQFGIGYLDEKAELLTDWSFRRKLDFLRKLKALTHKEYSKVKAFQEWRNKIFHRDGLEILYTMTEAEKDELMNQAVDAAQISFNVAFRTAHARPNGFIVQKGISNLPTVDTKGKLPQP